MILKTHLLTALRHFRRKPFFSAVNILGLSVGLAVCWLIGLYILHERNYDAFLPDADRIYAAALDLKMGDEEGFTTNTPPPLGPRLLADFPEIESAARTFTLNDALVKREKPGQAPLTFNEGGAYAVDTSFLELFGFAMAEGDPSTALDKPFSIVLSEKAANKYFGKEAAVGQSVFVNDRLFTVTAVARDLPSNSSLQFDFLLPVQNFKVVDRFGWSWIWLQMDTWVKLRKKPTKASLAALEAKFPAMVRQYAPAAYERVGQNFEEQIKKGDRYDVKLLPLLSLHLGQQGLISRLNTLGDAEQVSIFGIAGILILALACINFMNLSTARSLKRAREVGVRKALGSQKSALIGQFLSESVLTAALASVIALPATGAALPLFNRLTGYSFGFSDLFSVQILPWIILLPLLAGILGGLYPAFYLSGFQMRAMASYHSGTGVGGHKGVRSGLVVFQFAVSTVLMLQAFIIYKQLEFARTQTPGMNRENVLVIENARHLGDGAAKETFRRQLLSLPEVKEASNSTFLPSYGSFGDFYEPEQQEEGGVAPKNLLISSFLADAQLTSVLGIEFLAGRGFLSDGGGDSSSVILNETAVKAIGWKDPIGKWIRYPGNGNQRFQVVGIVRDFNIESVKLPVVPTAIFHESSKTYFTQANYLVVRIAPNTASAVIAKLGDLWKNTVPGAPFQYSFLDANFARLYQTEVKTGTVLGVFTGLALFIGCIGLLALAAFTAEQRAREIGVRKVLGASITGITRLLAVDFLKLVAAGSVLAIPIAYYFMHKRLEAYAYSVELKWWYFVLAAAGAVLIALLTVSIQSLKAALVNPVKSLRSE